MTVQPALYGDANLDGSVNAADLSKVLTAYGETGTWATGDFNYDGTVNAADLSKVLTNYGTTGGPSWPAVLWPASVRFPSPALSSFSLSPPGAYSAGRAVVKPHSNLRPGR